MRPDALIMVEYICANVNNVKLKTIIHFHYRKGSMSGTSLRCPSKALGMNKAGGELNVNADVLELFGMLDTMQLKNKLHCL